MTRQKKELLRKIHEIHMYIEVDEELGCGFAPPGAYDEAYAAIDALLNELAHLRGFNDYREMEQFEIDKWLEHMRIGKYDDLPFN